jgi:NAD(P)-dependent dehydrogenase (short-subunit alcohol dehydrogenase family)
MDLNLTDKKVLITGGTSGLGVEMVRAFLRSGALVVTNYHSDKESADRLIESVRGQHPGRLFVRQTDIAIEANAVELVRYAENTIGALDALVNNAAVNDPKGKDVFSFDDKDFDETFHTNVKGLIYVTRTAITRMKSRGNGHIVNMSSAGVYTANPAEVFYACSKAAVEAATRTFAGIGAPYGVTVNAVAPHLTDAGMCERDQKTHDEARVAKNPMLRVGRAEEVAALVLFLSSDACSYITGTVVPIDGGRPLRR